MKNISDNTSTNPKMYSFFIIIICCIIIPVYCTSFMSSYELIMKGQIPEK